MRNRVKMSQHTVEHDVYHSGNAPNASGINTQGHSDQQIIDRMVPYPPTRQTTQVTTVDSMSDVVIPGYAKLRKEGKILPTNPMSRSTVTHVEGSPNLRSIASVYWAGSDRQGNTVFMIRSHEARLPTTLGLRSLLSQRDIESVQVEALAKLRSQGMDVLTTAAEFRQTLSMLTGARAKLTDLITKAARLLRKKGKRIRSWNQFINEFMSSPWLEARFGWRILYYDLIAINDYLDTVGNGTKFIVGRSSEKASLSETIHGVTYKYTDEVKIGYPGTLDQSLPGHASLMNTTWELIPFSLVVDMFFSVQSRILAYSGAAVNVKEHHQASFITRELTATAVAQASMPGQPPPGNVSYTRNVIINEPALITLQTSSKTREQTSVPPLGLPSFRLNLGGYKPVDLAFLMRIIISKIF